MTIRQKLTRIQFKLWLGGLLGLSSAYCFGSVLLAQESAPPAAVLGPPISPYHSIVSPAAAQTTQTPPYPGYGPQTLPPIQNAPPALPAAPPMLFQDKGEKKQPPVGPGTKVEGKTTPPTTEQPFPPIEPPMPGAGGTPITQGGVFGSPSVDGYRAGSATTGTKIDIPLVDYPGSIAVVPQDLIRDQQAISILDLVRDFGASVTSFDTRRETFNVRGFVLSGRDYRWNGFLDPFTPFRDLANVERIELLKGPASVLYGSGQPSGVLNFITKKPLAANFGEFTVTGGSYGLYRTTLDVNGLMDPNGQFLFRMNAAYQHADSFRDFVFDERSFFAPSISWVIDQDTLFNVEASYTNDRRRFDSGLVAINGQIIDVPRSRFLNEPNDFLREDDYKIGASLYHRFNDCTAGRIAGFVTWLDAPQAGTVPFFLPGVDLSGPPFFFPAGTILRQRQNLDLRHEQYYSVIADLDSKFCTGPIRHNTLIGTEIGWLNSTNKGSTSDPLAPVFFPTPPFFNVGSAINVNNPVYNLPQPPLVGTFDSHLQQQRYGFYFQDLIDLNPNWKLLAGVRQDILHQEFGNGLGSVIGGSTFGSFPFTEAENNYYRTTPRVGLVYSPVPEVLSFYGSYALSFDPPVSGVFINPGDIKPETGQIVEGGIHMDLFCKRLALNAAGFYITKNNVAEQDPNNFLLLRQVAEERSQGAEFSAIGKLTDFLSIVANYAYVDARTLSDLDPLIVGRRLPNAPYNNASIWSRLNFIDNCTQTFGVGAGVVYVGDRPGDLTNTFFMPEYTRWDAGVFYRYCRLNAAVLFENVFDENYFVSAQNSQSVMPGNPFTVRATLGIKF